MGLTPGLPPETESLSNPEKRHTHRQYKSETIFAVSALKYLGELFKAKFNPPQHRRLVNEPIDATKVLLPPSKRKGGLTYFNTPMDQNFFNRAKALLTQSDQDRNRVRELLIAQILRLSGYEKESNEEKLLIATLESSKIFGKGIPMKIGSFFLKLFGIDKKHALKNKVEIPGRRDTIGESAGVYPIMKRRQAPEGFVEGKSDPLEVGAEHALNSLFTGTLQYLKDLSHQGGYHPDADRDPNLNPQAIQEGAGALFSNLLERGLLRHFAANKPFIEKFDQKLKGSKEAQKCLKAPSRCLVDPNVSIIADEKSPGEVRFHAESPIFAAKTGELTKIPVCVFNLDHTQYMMLDIGVIGNLNPKLIADLIKAEKSEYQTGWTNISELGNDPTRPVFALSITRNGKTPKGLIDNAGLNGESLIHYDFRVNDDRTVDCITHHGHTRQDGGSAAVYSELQDTVLPKVVPDSSPTVMELATLYPVAEHPANVHELLNKLGLSDIAVGEGYNQKVLKEHLKEINAWYNEAFSQQVYDTINLALQDNASIDAFIQALAAEHEQVGRRNNLYGHKAKNQKVEIPEAQDELEQLLDNLYMIKAGNTAMQERFTAFKEDNAVFKSIQQSLGLDQATNPDQVLKILGDNFPNLKERIQLHSKKGAEIPKPRENSNEQLIDDLIKLKKEPQFTQSLASIGSTASLIRNLISPNISEVHLFDMVLAARGGVVNCTLPLFDYLRLETAIAKRSLYLNPLLVAYQKLENTVQKQEFITTNRVGLATLFADLEVNLLDQTLSRLGLPTAGFFLERAGGATDQVALLGKNATPAAADISRLAYVQTSFLPGLVKFISALQADMPEQNVAVSGTDDGKGNGYLFYRANLAKPESRDLFLNMLDINAAVGEYERRKMAHGLLSNETNALRTRLRSSNNTLSKTLDEISKQSEELTSKQSQALKEILTIALQNDLHQTITKTQMLAEMLSIYANNPPAPQ